MIDKTLKEAARDGLSELISRFREIEIVEGRDFSDSELESIKDYFYLINEFDFDVSHDVMNILIPIFRLFSIRNSHTQKDLYWNTMLGGLEMFDNQIIIDLIISKNTDAVFFFDSNLYMNDLLLDAFIEKKPAELLSHLLEKSNMGVRYNLPPLEEINKSTQVLNMAVKRFLKNPYEITLETFRMISEYIQESEIIIYASDLLLFQKMTLKNGKPKFYIESKKIKVSE